jgi:hypothetical protein
VARGASEEEREISEAVQLYARLGRRLNDPSLAGSARKAARDQRRALLDMFGPVVRQDVKKIHHRDIQGKLNILEERKSSPDLSHSEREDLVEQQRQLLQTTRSPVPGSAYVTIRKPSDQGALLLLFGQDKVPSKTSFFIPASKFRAVEAPRRGPLGADWIGPPGTFNPPVDPNRLVIEIVRLAETLAKTFSSRVDKQRLVQEITEIAERLSGKR